MIGAGRRVGPRTIPREEDDVNHGTVRLATALTALLCVHCGGDDGADRDAAPGGDSSGSADGTPGGISITTDLVPDGIVDVAYSAEIQTAGGSGTGYEWAVVSGALPPGLSLTPATPAATLSGVPTEAGSFDFTLEVDDAQSGTATRAFSLRIVSALYVDPTIDSSSCTDYDPVARSCGSGASTAYDSLSGAAAVAGPGDTVLVRGATYSEQLAPQSSGAEGNPVTYAGYPGETVTLSGSFDPAAIYLDGVSWVVLERLAVDNARWLEAVDAHHNIIRDSTFTDSPASGTTGNVRFISSDYNIIRDNVITGGNDNLLLIDSDHNLVEGNAISEGRHSVWGIRCGDYNIIRGNTFGNSQQKIGEVYDCGSDTSAVPNSFDSTAHNLIEANVFTETSTYYSTSGGNGIQYAGQAGIIRANVFYGANVGLGMQVYSDEAEHNRDNRVYGNVFYDNNCAGISLSSDVTSSVFKNNILYQNRGISGDCDGDGSAQLVYRNPLAAVVIEHNDIFDVAAGDLVIQDEFGSGGSLADYESAHGDVFLDNVEFDPLFTNAAAHELTLQDGSDAIDGGAFLTTATSAGSGTAIPVVDAGYFSDGNDIDGERGDSIQLEGSSETARVLAVDTSANTLTLDRSLTWDQGQGVALRYAGAAPDLGAFESE